MANLKENVFVISGTLTSAFYGCKTFGNKKTDEQAFFTIKTDIGKIKKISEKEIITETFKNSSMKPKWISSPEATDGYMNFHSKYSIPVAIGNRIYDSDTILIDKDVDFANRLIGSKVKIQFVVKEKGVYPKALKILELGEEYNPFDSFEEYEENIFIDDFKED